MNHYQLRPNWKIYSWLAVAGIVVYLIIQVVPQTSQAFFGTDDGTGPVIAKRAAENTAAAFIDRQFGQPPHDVHAVHQSDSMLYGYLSKEKLFDSYDSKYDAKFPTDTFQVNASLEDGSLLFVYVHMQRNEVVGWNRFNTSGVSAPDAKQAEDAARKFAEAQGFKPAELKLARSNPAAGETVLAVDGYSIGEAKLMLELRAEQLPGGIVITQYEPKFTVPDAYRTYVDAQTKLAAFLSLLGSFMLSFALFVLAVIYAAVYRKHTSFVRGIALSALFLVMYLANDINLKDGIIAGSGESPDAVAYAAASVVITCVITVFMGISVYFALVGGDGLWNAMGRRLWPRFREPGYGDYVWRSMWLGYLIAFMLLGLQTVIFIVLLQLTGAWSTSDVTQSQYNLSWPWLFPLLAWCAAISEEALYRFFGVGLFKRWFRNTFAAAIIPTLVWALGHVTYPIFPSTTRLFELTIIGLVFSFMFVRYGFMTVVFAHAVFDSIMMAIALMFMGTAGNIALGILYILLPIPIAWSIRWLDARFPRKPRDPARLGPPPEGSGADGAAAAGGWQI